VRILFIGDIIGNPGRRAVRELLPDLVRARQIEFVIANAENAAGGKGLTPEVAEELFNLGIHVLTNGNHVWKNKEILKIIDRDPRVLRPANFPENAGVPGRGSGVFTVSGQTKIGVLNLIGRVFMLPYECPFRVARREVNELRRTTPLILVDFHAEATSEKVALGWHLDGEATAVIGTHTHIPTADETVTARGTAFLTDVGMTGPYDSVIGVRKEPVIEAMLSMMPARHEPAKGDVRLCAALIDADPYTGRAQGIERICVRLKE
jgi:hypothetical protein